MGLSDLITRKPVTAKPKDSLALVGASMKQQNVGAIVVTEGKRPVGIVTDRDLALAICVDGKSSQEHVQNVMTAPVTTIYNEDGVFKATQLIMDRAVRRLPVVDKNGDLVGLLALDDLLLLLSRELQSMAEGVKAEAAAA